MEDRHDKAVVDARKLAVTAWDLRPDTLAKIDEFREYEKTTRPWLAKAKKKELIEKAKNDLSELQRNYKAASEAVNAAEAAEYKWPSWVGWLLKRDILLDKARRDLSEIGARLNNTRPIAEAYAIEVINGHLEQNLANLARAENRLKQIDIAIAPFADELAAVAQPKEQVKPKITATGAGGKGRVVAAGSEQEKDKPQELKWQRDADIESSKDDVLQNKDEEAEIAREAEEAQEVERQRRYREKG